MAKVVRPTSDWTSNWFARKARREAEARQYHGPINLPLQDGLKARDDYRKWLLSKEGRREMSIARERNPGGRRG